MNGFGIAFGVIGLAYLVFMAFAFRALLDLQAGRREDTRKKERQWRI